MSRIPVGVLGATGTVGHKYIERLQNHPWFELVYLGASSKSEGRTVANMPVESVDDIDAIKNRCRIVFSCIGDSQVAYELEEAYAAAGLIVISNTSAHRGTVDVPVIIPEVNPHHLNIIPIQRTRHTNQKGALVVKPNCSLQSYLIPLFALHQQFPVKRIMVTTLQAVSGAGNNRPDVDDNVIPHIDGEEEKSEQEPLKILGQLGPSGISLCTTVAISAHCNRVAVEDGHLACVSVEFEKKPSMEEMIELWEKFPSLQLPSAPPQTIIYRPEPNRPQPRLDRDAGNGMAISVGRLRTCPILDYRFVALSHNTGRGAAGGGILNAELFVTSKYFD